MIPNIANTSGIKKLWNAHKVLSSPKKQVLFGGANKLYACKQEILVESSYLGERVKTQ
jgi:hypothetical protein